MSSKEALDKAAHVIMAAVRDAYTAQPGAMPVMGITVHPLQVLVADDTSSQLCRVPVIPGPNATVSFGAPLSGVAAARGAGGVCARDTERIAAAVSRGAIPPYRAAFWAACAAAGQDIAAVDQLVGGFFAAAAAQSPPDDYARMFGASQARPAENDGPEYSALFASADEGQRRADERRGAARTRAAAMTEDEVHQELFGPPRRKAPVAPITASAAGAGKPRPQEYVRHPNVSLRVPDLTASAGDGGTKWRSIVLCAGDRVPADAHPEDLDQLRHRMNRHGAAIKEW